MPICFCNASEYQEMHVGKRSVGSSSLSLLASHPCLPPCLSPHEGECPSRHSLTIADND